MAMKKRGIRCLPPVDLFKGPYKWDLADEAILRRVLRLIVKAAILYAHLGTPCTRFSAALRGLSRTRSQARPWGDPELDADQVANALVAASVRIIKLLVRLGRRFTL